MPRTVLSVHATFQNMQPFGAGDDSPSPGSRKTGQEMPKNQRLDGLAPRSTKALMPSVASERQVNASAREFAMFHALQPGPADMSPGDLGARIGSGSQKDVFLLRGRPGACVALIRQEAIGHFDTPLSHAQREMGALLHLKSRGFRTVEVYSLVRVGGKIGIEQAYLPRVKNSADIVASGGVVPEGRYLTAVTVSDCDANISTLRETNTVVDDLQFLVEESGSMHITDPRAVFTGDPSKSVGSVKALRGLALSAILPSDDESD